MMSAPSAWTPRIVQDFTETPSSSTVQAPHEDVSQPTFVPVSASLSRRTCTNRSRGSTSSSCCVPLTVKAIGRNRTSFVRGWIEPTPPAMGLPREGVMVALMIEIREIGDRELEAWLALVASVRAERAGSVEDYLDWKRQAEDMGWFVASSGDDDVGAG